MKETQNETTSALAAEPGVTGEGIIVSHFGVAVEVLLNDGERRIVRVKRNSGHVVGDDVVVAGEVLKRLPRRTELRRRDIRGGIHLVAANLDTLGIVLAPMSPSGFADRAIVAARAAGLEPFLIFNKCDLPEGEEVAGELGAIYADILPCFPLSAVTGAGIEALRGFMKCGHRGVFVGSTGVGKSSLLNALIPGLDLKVAAVSDHRWLGKHTTTVSSLHTMPGGGELVDTPGFRDFGLVDVSVAEVMENFPGIETVDGGCRFHNCRHRQEPGCGVAALVEAGKVSAERYQSYLALLSDVEAAEDVARPWKK